MKKILSLFIDCILLTGCETGELLNTPTKKVEMFLGNYQTLNSNVVEQLDDVIENETIFNDTQKETYRDIMKKHYKNLTYEIKDEKIYGDMATVTVEIEVTDYTKVMTEAEKYKTDNPNEFNNDEGIYDESLFTNYRLENLKNAKDRVKYTIDFTLTKNDDEWELDSLTEEQESKIHGLYSY